MPWSQIFGVANMSFNAIHENKVFAKVSGFTVLVLEMLVAVEPDMQRVIQ